MQTQIQALALLPKLSEQQLVQALQGGSGELPAYAVMAELQARKKRAAGFGGAEAPQTSVKDDMVAQTGGLQSLSPMARGPMAQPVQEMAGGGMPGRPEDDDFNYANAPWYGAGLGPYVPETEQPLPGVEEDRRRLREILEKQKRGLARVGASAADVASLIPRGLMGAYNATVVRGGRAAGLPMGYIPDVAGGDYSSMTPFYDKYVRKPEAAAAAAAPTAWGGENRARPLTVPGTLPDAAAKNAPPAEGGIKSAGASVRTSNKAAGPAGPAAEGFKPPEIKLRSVQEALGDLPKDTSIEEAIASLKAGDTSAEDRERAKWEAMMRMGIGMATTPGNFMTGLARGAGAGLDSLGQSQNEIRKMQIEREKEMRNLAIAQGRQGLERYGIANQTRFGEAGIADKNVDNLTKAWQVGVESNDRRLQMQNALQVASIHAAASRMAQTDLGKMKLVNDITTKASDDFDKSREGINITKWMNVPPAQVEQARAAFIADRLKMVPGLEKFYTLPSATPAADPYAVYEKPGGKALGKVGG
jgi:hypothetical protein